MKNNQLNYIVGDAFEDMNIEEMALTQGIDVEGRGLVIASIAISKASCAATVTAVIGSVSAWINNN